MTKDYISFFKGLEKNNSQEWFHGHKKEYETEVKKPFLNLLDRLIPELLLLDPAISPNSKDALFRINRDIRFSKDKTPYHTILKASFAPGGKKSILPGFYLGIDAEKVHLGGGLFNVKGPELKAVRQLIAENTQEFNQIVNSDLFFSTFGEMKGERAKRLDKAFQETLEKTPFIANKQFYAMQNLTLADYLNGDKLYDEIIASFKAIHPLNQFLKKALS